jgi:hypothetical protein
MIFFAASLATCTTMSRIKQPGPTLDASPLPRTRRLAFASSREIRILHGPQADRIASEIFFWKSPTARGGFRGDSADASSPSLERSQVGD